MNTKYRNRNERKLNLSSGNTNDRLGKRNSSKERIRFEILRVVFITTKNKKFYFKNSKQQSKNGMFKHE